jgi:hypothetical protein
MSSGGHFIVSPDSLIATSAMAAWLLLTGYGWEPGSAQAAYGMKQLFIASVSGAVAYTVVLVGLWLASGRPTGPETDIQELIRRACFRAGGSLGRRAALLWSGASR